MKIGTFFECDQWSRKDQVFIFRYRKVVHASDLEPSLEVPVHQNSPFSRTTRYYPIYVKIQRHKLSFFFQDLLSHSHKKLMEIPMLEGDGWESEINLAVNELFISEPILTGKGKSEYKKIAQNHKIAYYPIVANEKGNEKSEKESRNPIVLTKEELLLDFLFDLEQSNVFKSSPNWRYVKNLVRNNALLYGILSKSKAFYALDRLQEEPAEGRKEIFEHFAIEHTKIWMNLLMEENSPEDLGNCNWFEQGTEGEIKDIREKLKSLKLKHPGSYEKIKAKLPLEELANWFLTRMNFRKAWQTSFWQSQNNKKVFGLMIFLPFAGLACLINVPTGVCLIAAIFTIGADFLWAVPKSERTNFLAVIGLFVPRLLIALFITWVGVTITLIRIPILDPWALILYLIVAIILVGLYLAREIKIVAPDIPGSNKIYQRIALIVPFTLALTSVMGALILSVVMRQEDQSFVKGLQMTEWAGYEIAFQTWATATIFTFFFGLFVNLLFKGQKFTGF